MPRFHDLHLATQKCPSGPCNQTIPQLQAMGKIHAHPHKFQGIEERGTVHKWAHGHAEIDGGRKPAFQDHALHRHQARQYLNLKDPTPMAPGERSKPRVGTIGLHRQGSRLYEHLLDE